MTARTACPASRAVKSVLKPMNPAGPVIYLWVNCGVIDTTWREEYQNDFLHIGNLRNDSLVFVNKREEDDAGISKSTADGEQSKSVNITGCLYRGDV
jgi:hypothetical protein